MMKKKILVVDDDSRNVFALTATLKAKGYEYYASTTAIEALDFIRTKPDIGIVLLDMMMPDMDGYEAIPEIKSIRAQLPVISVTAQAMVGDREKCLEVGADDYVSKPINVDRLLVVIDHFIK
jgi:CheY-like chemotaxis protein